MDEEQFTDFYLRTARPLWRYVARVSGSPTIADDVLQESYCRYLSADLPPMNDSERKSYLFRIATNLTRDRWRRSRNVSERETKEGSLVPELESALDMHNALHHLRPRERQLLWLAYVEEASHAEIAQVTGLRSASIRTLLLRARHRLAAFLRPESPAKNSSEDR